MKATMETFELEMEEGTVYREASALLDGPYRYTLSRAWAPGGKTACVVGLNPSTATATEDDHTIRRLIQLLGANGYARMILVNLYAWRATQPVDLWLAWKRGEGVVGPANAAHCGSAIEACDAVVLAWGSGGPEVADRARRAMTAAIRASGKPLLCFGRTKDGAPRHPSRLPRSARLEVFA